MTEQKQPEQYLLSDLAYLILECADRGWLRHLDGAHWRVSPGRGNGHRMVVREATGQKLARDGLVELTSGIACRVTKFGHDVLALRRAAGWALEPGVGHKPRLRQESRESDERPADVSQSIPRPLQSEG